MSAEKTTIPIFARAKIAAAILPALLAMAGCQTGPEKIGPPVLDSLDARIGQMIMVGFRGLSIGPDDQIAKDIRRLNLGGVILFDKDVALGSLQRNIRDPQQVRKLVEQLQAQAAVPLFLGIDVEGGRVNRLKEQYGFPATVSAAQLGKGGADAAFLAADAIGRTLRELGINVDFAPVLDVNVNPDNPVIGKIGRSFSADPKIVATHGAAFIHGLHARGVLACAKHFPGHGSSTADSHLGVTDVTNTWTPEELLPYKLVLQPAKKSDTQPANADRPDMVMIGHLFNRHWDEKYPATLSESVIQGMLRGELGFDGVVITDDMQMKAITDQFGLAQAVCLAVNAGADILLFGNNLVYDPQLPAKVHAMIKKMVADGKIPRQRIDQSAKRIAILKASFAGSHE